MARLLLTFPRWRAGRGLGAPQVLHAFGNFLRLLLPRGFALDDRGFQKDHELTLDQLLIAGAEQAAQHRKIARARDAGARIALLLPHEAADGGYEVELQSGGSSSSNSVPAFASSTPDASSSNANATPEASSK